MNTVVSDNRLNAIFCDRSFIEANKDLDNVDSIYAAVKARDSEITYDEFIDYISRVSDYMNATDAELSEDQLADVAGGIGWEGALAILSFCYGVGNALGTTVRNWGK